MIDEKYFEIPPAAEEEVYRTRRRLWMRYCVASQLILTPLFLYTFFVNSFWSAPLALALGVTFLAFWKVGAFKRAYPPKEAWTDIEIVDDLMDKGDLVAARGLCEERLKLGLKNIDCLAYFLIRYAIIEFMEGDAENGIRLGDMAMQSGWLDPSEAILGQDWVIMMWIHLGEVEKAMAIWEASELAFYSQLLFQCHFEQWSEILETIHPPEDDDVRDDADHDYTGFLVDFASVIGRYASSQLGRPTSKFDHRTANLSGRVRLNPALQAYLPERRLLFS